MSNTYPIALADFPGGAVNEDKLRDEVNASEEIIPHCSDVGISGLNVNVTFLGPLSGAEQTELEDTIVPAHDNSPTPADAVPAEITNKPDVYVRKPDGARAYVFGVDFTDQKTWYTVAEQVIDEDVGTGNGILTAFQLDHGALALAGEVILNLCQGLITDDHLMAPPGGSVGGFCPVIELDGVPLTMREPYETGGGDYLLDFVTGLVTFFTPPGVGVAITASYYYVPAGVGPLLKAGPPPGKKWTIDKAEAQISADLETDDWFTDTIMMNVFHTPSGFTDPANEVRYHNYGNLLDYAAGSFVSYPACSGARGIAKPTHIFRWEYQTPITLYPDFEIRAWTKHARPLAASRATVVMYALEEDL